ncbi:hypothetical protein AS034_16025 [[Bacillus] enclensis]|uniref:Putative cross-wall-targeting lipoprotein signal n=1 Tax=[Bacillus] enclensis TaxID=1402860 RepID=A0A0V8HCS3_9BACI|nr:hypothetical protein [[Bacillus] enclensis]KSU60350.1 hypothetical protein AS034_16025 [[Bacillus] enclensis]SCC23481.1 putative cross-wall-targeting lipoprotein signal [[Bacillus] enclensis]
MGVKKKIVRTLGGIALAGAVVVGGFGSSASAYQDSVTEPISQLSGNDIQSNIWMSATAFYQTQRYQVSAKFLGYNPPNADWVKTAWNIKANGLGVSIGGVSGGTASGNELSGTWTNYNNWISDYSGSYNISGVPISGSGNNTANFLALGVKDSATASIFRWY